MRHHIAGTIALLSLVGLTMAATSAFAQTPQPAAPPPQSASSKGCEARQGDDASKAEAATQPKTAAADGTAPGNAGSTGWTGGTGGALIGNNPQGASKDSPNWQPPTARGLDLQGNAEPAPQAASGC